MLTPIDIHNKEFSQRMRGYDQDEVNDFLDLIIKDYETLIREKRSLEDKLASAEDKLSYFEDMQESLNKSIIVAQEAADRLQENAHKEARIMEQEAQSNADKLLQEAVDKARKIEEETEDLRKQSRVFRQRLQVMIESQLEMVKKDEWDELLSSREVPPAEIQTIKEVAAELDYSNEFGMQNYDESEEGHATALPAEEVENLDNAVEDDDNNYALPAIEIPEIE